MYIQSWGPELTLLNDCKIVFAAGVPMRLRDFWWGQGYAAACPDCGRWYLWCYGRDGQLYVHDFWFEDRDSVEDFINRRRAFLVEYILRN